MLPDGLSVAHGLASTPSVVFLTGTDMANQSIWYSDVGSTYFVVHIQNQTTGLNGTPQTVSWWAEV